MRCFRFRGIVWSILSCIVLILAPFISRGSQQAFAYTTLQVAVDNYYNGYVHLTVGRYSQFKPVTATGGSGSVIYSISPALPSGLNIVADTGLIFGVLTQSTGLVNYTITAFDTVTTNSASATINIHAHSALSVNVSISSKTVSVNTYQAGFTPVTVSGGANPVTCSISPPLPPGLSIASDNYFTQGTISGTPTEPSGTNNYTVTFTDVNGSTATATFSLKVYGSAVSSQVDATQAIVSKTVTYGQATSFTPVTGSGGTSPLAYTVSPALPSGLSLASSTGVVTGTPARQNSATTYTVTVTDANMSTATADFSLTVNQSVQATQAIATKTLTKNAAATSFTPVTGSRGTSPLAYTVSPGLPAGLSMASSTGAITGTPTGTSAATTYTVTATDANGSVGTATFSLTVNDAPTATVAVSWKTLTKNIAATSFTPVTGAGGTSPLTYSVSPTLPSGLSMGSSTGAITGTPTGTSAATTYTVTVTDANGATGTATFSLTVNDVVTAAQAIATKTLTKNCRVALRTDP